MAIIKYLYEPAAQSVYKVQEQCCYTQVVYEGPKKGIYSRIDRDDEVNGPLLCQICDANRLIKEVTREFYQTCYDLVCQSMKPYKVA